jgi:molybdate transport system regulatory protein
MPTRLTVRLDFDAGRRLGVGKIALLEAIEKTGSISAAGRLHEMSYRRAWLLVDELNQLFAAPLVAAHHGGAKGGGALLTEEGRRIVALYRGAEAKMRAAAGADIDAIEAMLAPPGRAQRGGTPADAVESPSKDGLWSAAAGAPTSSSRRGRTA